MKYVVRVAVLLCITACSRAEQQASGSPDSANHVQVSHPAVDSVGPPPVADSFTAAPDSPLVLFRMDTDVGGQYFLDPMALISGDQLVRPPVGDMNDSAANVFRQTFYGRGQGYRVVGGGEDLGLAGAAAAIDPGCFGLEAYAHLKLARPAPHDVILFATNAGRIRGDAAIRRPLSGEDREVLYSHISQVLADSGVPPAFRGHSFMIAGARIETPGANSFIIGMFKVDSTENGGDRIISVLLGLDSTGSGYRPTLFTYYNGLDADAAVERFVDMLEIDGSPPPELITRTTFYESYTYTVYRKKPSGWQPWYTGGGGGC